MNRKFGHCKGALSAILLALALVPLSLRAAPSTNSGYTELSIVSDLASNAVHHDTRLLNAWGIVATPNQVWVADNHSGLATVYSSTGNPSKSSVNVPAPGGGAGAPTGLVLNNTSSFVITNGSKHAPSTYITATEDGTLVAWTQSVTGTNAVIVADRSASGAIYKGLAIAPGTNGAPQIYAANFHAGVVDVFDGHFNYVQSFTDTNLPDHFAPFNVRTIRGRLFVTFAKQDADAEDDEAGPGNGYVDIFDKDGTLLRRFASQGALDSPWGMVIAPKNFGKFSHALLVGNFGDGTISGYDLLTGKWLGYFTKSDGNILHIQGLWGLTFEKEETPDYESDFNAQRLYFTAGPNGEADGVLGILRPVSPSFPPAQ